jgi:hypothetical protein
MDELVKKLSGQIYESCHEWVRGDIAIVRENDRAIIGLVFDEKKYKLLLFKSSWVISRTIPTQTELITTKSD